MSPSGRSFWGAKVRKEKERKRQQTTKARHYYKMHEISYPDIVLKTVCLKTVQDASPKARFGIMREPEHFEIEVFMLKTLKGPRLEQNELINESSF